MEKKLFKMVKVREDAHRILKSQAANQGMKLEDMIVLVINEYVEKNKK